MSRFSPPTEARPRRTRALVVTGLLALGAVALAGCSGTGGPGRAQYLGLPDPASDRAVSIGHLWVGAWIACLAIGVFVWGLMGWAFIRFRRRHANEVPRQTRYNLPLEVLYTIAPFFVIGVLFFYTVQTQDKVLAKVDQPQHTIDVVGQKWSWTFNYREDKNPAVGSNVWEAGTFERYPTLYLPVNETVRFNLQSPDVIHSFWIPAFYFKLDVIPGRHNSFDVTPNREGEFIGKCAELCGTYHSAMLFKVKVVDRATYDAKLNELKAQGQTGTATGSTGVAQPVPAGASNEEGGK